MGRKLEATERTVRGDSVKALDAITLRLHLIPRRTGNVLVKPY